MSKTPNYTPPSYPVRHHDRSVLVDKGRATRFMEFRKRLCDKLGDDNEVCNPINLWWRAMDLLMAQEDTLTSETLPVAGEPWKLEVE